MHNASADDTSIHMPALWRGEKDVKFPLEMVKAIAELEREGRKIVDAVRFYNIVKDAKDYRWVEASALLNMDVSGYEIWTYYEDNYSSSWDSHNSYAKFTLSEFDEFAVDGFDAEGFRLLYHLSITEQVLLVTR